MSETSGWQLDEELTHRSTDADGDNVDDDDSGDDDSGDATAISAAARVNRFGAAQITPATTLTVVADRDTSLVVGGGATPLLPRAAVERVAASAWLAAPRSHSLPPLLTALYPGSRARRAEAASDGLPPGQARTQARKRAFHRVPPRALPH